MSHVLAVGADGASDAGAGAAPGGSAAGSRAAWPHRHLLDTDVLTWPQIELVLDTARHMVEIVAGERPRSTALRGVGVTNLFYEASTRTRVSFEVAARHLSADVVNVAVSGSSIEKGESLLDTMRTLEALGAKVLVIRHATSGAPYLVARAFRGSVVNAGDGRHAHPTQALLDLATLLRHVPGGSLRGRKVVILGDILHSRVARSNLWTLTAAGADVWLCGPATLLRGFDAWAAAGVGGERRFTVTSDVAAALRDADAVMALRIQKERMASGLLPSLHEYAARFGLTKERLATAAEGCVVMHPGPVNEGIEIASDVANGPHSLVTEQVATGVAIRMAVLSLVTSVAP
ncbi:MAG TPA: aspartate carbamoyltransferase catalytic subunit [Candidatus Dormibacteraeota bacterium]|nr:aspartate carbamoyltransferase catalytic subunit [Candidatus Dormibacteraeota bacterium]